MSSATRRRFLPIAAIMLAVLVWGVFHALGVFLFNRAFDYRKPIIVMGCVGGFLLFWILMLVMRERRQSSDSRFEKNDEGDAPNG